MVAVYSQLLQRQFGDKLGPTGDEYIGYTIQGARRMESLLRDLRTYTQTSEFKHTLPAAAPCPETSSGSQAGLPGKKGRVSERPFRIRPEPTIILVAKDGVVARINDRHKNSMPSIVTLPVRHDLTEYRIMSGSPSPSRTAVPILAGHAAPSGSGAPTGKAESLTCVPYGLKSGLGPLPGEL